MKGRRINSKEEREFGGNHEPLPRLSPSRRSIVINTHSSFIPRFSRSSSLQHQQQQQRTLRTTDASEVKFDDNNQNDNELEEKVQVIIDQNHSLAHLPTSATAAATIPETSGNLRRRINRRDSLEQEEGEEHKNMAPHSTGESSEELASFLPGNHDIRRNKTSKLGGFFGVLIRKRRLVFYITISIILASQIWLWGPTVLGEERMNTIGGKWEQWKPFQNPPPSFMEGMEGGYPPPPPPPPPPTNVEHDAAPPGPPKRPPKTADTRLGTASNGTPIYKPKWELPSDYGDPIKEEEESWKITSDSAFPPPVVKYSTKFEPAKAVYNYRDGDPHQGVIPQAQLAILERDIPRKAPIKGTEPIDYPEEIYTSKGSWSRSVNGSSSKMEDALIPDAQPIEKDWRPNPYHIWRPPKMNLDSTNSRFGFGKSVDELPRVQYPFRDPNRFSGDSNEKERDAVIEQRRRLIRSAFLHSWEAYKESSWGHDEISPISGQPSDTFNGWGATIVDALDTLLIMDLPAEYDLARQHVRDIDFHFIGGSRSAYGNSDGKIPVFETAIRYLGGFLSAYDLSGDELMRDRAEELAQLIMPAFETLTGVPIGRLNLDQPGLGFTSGSSVVVAEAASMLLEMTRLWQVTGNRTYFDRVQRTTDWLQYNMTGSPDRLGSLLPSTIFPERGTMYGWYSWGGMVDSAFEYLIKEHQLLGGRLDQYAKFFSDSVDSARRWLMRGVNTVPDTPLFVIGQSNGKSFTPKLEHLACFTGGAVGLGSKLLSRPHDLHLARRIAETCWWAYNSTETGIGPESMTFYRDTDPDRYETKTLQSGTARRGRPRGAPIVGVRQVSSDYRGRPETIESVYYMWRITGDRQWQERGWQMFCSWVTHSLTKHGFASITNVLNVPASLRDSMESYVFAETFKYYYLLFSPPSLISLDEYVFSTEAHPFLLPTKDGKWGIPGQGSRRFWDPKVSHEPTSTGEYTGGENGENGGLTRIQKQFIYEGYQRQIKAAERFKLIEQAKKFKAKLKGEKTKPEDDTVKEEEVNDPNPNPLEVDTNPIFVIKSEDGKDSENETIVKLLNDVQRRASVLGEEEGKSFIDQLSRLLTTSSDDEIEGDGIVGKAIQIDRRELEEILSDALDSIPIEETEEDGDVEDEEEEHLTHIE